MANPRTVKLFLLDGSPSGRIKCSLSNWVGQVYLIPRNLVHSSKDRPELNQTGIYILLGKHTVTEKPLVYVGQANKRKNAEGVRGRVMEHLAKDSMDWVNRAIIVITSDNSFGPTEVSHLENALHYHITKADRATLFNAIEPSAGHVTEEKRAELSEFISYLRITVGSLGSRIFEHADGTNTESSIESSEPSAGSEELLVLNTPGAHGEGRRTNEGFVVFRGAQLRLTMTDSVPESARKNRALYAEHISDNGKLLEDVSLSSPSAASNFLIGASTNGKTLWKNSNGITLGELERAEFEKATRNIP